MGQQSHARSRPGRLLLGGSLLIVLLCWPHPIGQAQTGCPPVSNNGFPKCAIVYYSITGFDSTQSPQITAALSAWTTANQSNNSRVKFVAGTAPPGGRSLTIRTGTTVSGAPAETTKSPLTGATTSATITFNLNYTIAGTNPPQLIYDPNVAGYNTIFRKVMLHELGHTMGLRDEPVGTGNCGGQTLGNSVMNGICNRNDGGGAMPTNVQTCDNQSVNSETLYPAGNCYQCDGASCVQNNLNGTFTTNNCDNTCDPCGGDPCCGDPCCGDWLCCGDPCCGDPCCGDPCCEDPCCGDPCCGDPNCGQDCYEVCVAACGDNETCWEEDPYTRECYVFADEVCCEYDTVCY